MALKNIILGMVFIGLFAGIVMALTGATVVSGAQSRWNQSLTAGSLLTQGGNITSVNVSTSQLTVKWAAFYGNVSGSVVLGNSSSYVYLWTYSVLAGVGEVCISANSSQGFLNTSANVTNFTALDAAFNITGASPDNSSNTFTSTCPAMQINTPNPTATLNLTGFSAITHAGSSSFKTCAANSSGSAIGNYFFCTNINGTGLNYKGEPFNYELMAPAGASAGTTYYFYLELS